MIANFLIATLVTLLIAVLHWFPWPLLLRGPLPRLVAYTLGVAVILGVPSAAFLLAPPASVLGAVAMFWVAGVAAGVATAGAWLIDAALSNWHRGKDLEDAAHERAQRIR
jgi:hypothetical protein